MPRPSAVRPSWTAKPRPTPAPWPAIPEAAATPAPAGAVPQVVITYTVPYGFSGFQRPVDNLPTVNSAKAGQTVPLRWRLTEPDGRPVTDLTEVSLTTTDTAPPPAGTPVVAIEKYAGNSGLQNLGNGNYQYDWKTPAGYANTVRALHLDLGDGTDRTARFSFTK